MRLVICASLAVMRECLRARLEAEPDIDVVAEVADCARLVDVAAEHRPDVLLLDADAPGWAPTEVVRGVAEASPVVRVVVIGRKGDPRAPALLELGVAGFLSEEANVGDLLAALRAAPIGVTTVDPAVIRSLSAAPADAPTARQLEVLRLVAEGDGNRAIADRLGIAERTVEFHLRRLFARLGAVSRTELVKVARERTWLA